MEKCSFFNDESHRSREITSAAVFIGGCFRGVDTAQSSSILDFCFAVVFCFFFDTTSAAVEVLVLVEGVDSVKLMREFSLVQRSANKISSPISISGREFAQVRILISS